MEAIQPEWLTAGERAWLARLPPFLMLDTPAGRAIVAHGFGADDFHWIEADSQPLAATGHAEWRRLRAESIALHIGGHTHRTFVRWIADLEGDPYAGATFINAGTLHRGHKPCVCVVDTSERTVAWHPVEGCGFASPRVARW